MFVTPPITDQRLDPTPRAEARHLWLIAVGEAYASGGHRLHQHLIQLGNGQLLDRRPLIEVYAALLSFLQ
jgi:hypothetical protein